MRVFLITPPVSNIGQAPPSTSVLAAWLTELGYDCQQWDLGIDAFHYFHSHTFLTKAVETIRSRYQNGSFQDDSTARSRLESADKIASEIESSKKLLQEPGVETDLARMNESLSTIQDAGTLISASHGLARFSYSRFDIPGALSNWESLAECIRDPSRSFFVDFYRKVALPRIGEAAPDLVGISVSYHSQLLPSLSLVILLKESFPRLPILLGGAYLKSVQNDLQKMPSWVVPADGICIGDGEPTLTAYLQMLTGNVELQEVPNLLIPRQDRFQSTGKWNQLSLNHAPVPMMSMEGLNLQSYLIPAYAIPLPVTRGCHYHRCVFCNISNQAHEKYRSRHASLCVSDIKTLIRKYHTRWFDFPTDSIHPSDLERLSEELIDKGLSTVWAAEVLLDRRLTNERIKSLARSGCCCLRFGLESASPRTLQLMEKKIDLNETTRILRCCHEEGIKNSIMLIVGFPTETQRDLMETVEYVQKHASLIDFLTIHQFSVAPGSRLAEQPESAGIHLLPRRGVLTPSLPYAHTNPVAMRPEDLSGVVSSLSDALSEEFPQCGRLWASGIGGWLTFAASHANPSEFFKQKLPSL